MTTLTRSLLLAPIALVLLGGAFLGGLRTGTAYGMDLVAESCDRDVARHQAIHHPPRSRAQQMADTYRQVMADLNSPEMLAAEKELAQ